MPMPPRPFANVMMLAFTPSVSHAKSCPVRPIPVWTSSAIRSIPVFLAICATAEK
ncbi:MAG: hypothetical protein QOE55_6568 [Acidobacteriaceae bacterium]|nr:hypothetical protein [Acidobacteriaceae bacterium]